MVVNILAEKVDRAVGEEEIGSAGMIRFVTPRHIPILLAVTWIVAVVAGTWVDRIVNRNDGRGMAHTGVEAGPPFTMVSRAADDLEVVVLVNDLFADGDRVGQPIGDAGKTDLDATAERSAPQL